MTLSALHCEHANEVPHVCPCVLNCYCKEHTCKPGATMDHVLEGPVCWDDIDAVFHQLWGNASAGRYDKDGWKKLQRLLELVRRKPESMELDEGVLQVVGSRKTRTGYALEIRVRKG